MVATVLAYTRGSTYIKNVSGGKACYGLVGELQVHGYLFETIERFSLDGLDFVHLKAQEYSGAVMYWHSTLGRVLNPWNGLGPNAQYNNILVHRGTKPSSFEGCIDPGFLEMRGSAQELTLSKESMEIIWEQCGGKPNAKPGWSM